MVKIKRKKKTTKFTNGQLKANLQDLNKSQFIMLHGEW